MAHPYHKYRDGATKAAQIMKANGGSASGDDASFDERYPRGIWSGGKGPSIDAAFSGADPSKTEFPLGNALRAKAKKMQEK